MQKLLFPIALCSVIALAATAAFSGNEQVDKSPMLSQLKVGQPVRLIKAISGGYNVEIINDRFIKGMESANQKYVPQKIIEVGYDFIIVDVGSGYKHTISVRAIDVITHFPSAKDGKEENEKGKENPK